MTKSLRLAAVIALGLTAGATVLSPAPAAAETVALPGVSSAIGAQCAPATPRGPLGY
ncbi:hypothetical protein [Magnetospirillum aberrantis]|uniref:Uncharacterized protein n=1 Tax=Magnetospirillum aberrantis SpK TaxID=908842 RepID=A0A7C9QUW8_9PROT|nr:hypothetical protein [Magnetospirillum aberrantis]NFV81082.1 hypothetical protein [Magnetospirillum aberrantis SpK]